MVFPLWHRRLSRCASRRKEMEGRWDAGEELGINVSLFLFYSLSVIYIYKYLYLYILIWSITNYAHVHVLSECHAETEFSRASITWDSEWPKKTSCHDWLNVISVVTFSERTTLLGIPCPRKYNSALQDWYLPTWGYMNSRKRLSFSFFLRIRWFRKDLNKLISTIVCSRKLSLPHSPINP